MSTARTRLDTSLVRELAEILSEASLGEIEIEHEGLRIRVSKPAAPVAAPVQAYSAPPPAVAVPAPAPQAGTASTQAAASAGNDADTVRSPMVGTVYLSPDPDSADFVKEGDKVKKGDTLMLVEAMKTFNPVESPRDGTVRKILVSSAQPVEYGEPLIIVS